MFARRRRGEEVNSAKRVGAIARRWIFRTILQQLGVRLDISTISMRAVGSGGLHDDIETFVFPLVSGPDVGSRPTKIGTEKLRGFFCVIRDIDWAIPMSYKPDLPRIFRSSRGLDEHASRYRAKSN